MDDLFKQFRKSLEGRPEPKFDKLDWQNLEKQLGPQPEKRRMAFAWWWLAVPFMLLSLGSNVLFFNALQETQKKVFMLEMRRDTVYLTKTVFQTDTVFQTKLVRETIVRYLPPVFAASTSLKAEKPFEIPKDTALGQKNFTVAKDGGNTPKSGSSPSEFLPPAAARLPLRWGKLRFQRSMEGPKGIALELVKKKRGRTIQQQLYLMRPKDFQLAAKSGPAFPFSKGLERRSGYLLGIEASTGFSPNLRLWGEATWFNIRFLSRRMDENLGVPVIDAPTDDFTFLQAETRQPMIQYALGMQYIFRAKKHLRPSLGIGYGAVSVLPYDISYEFVDHTLGTEWNIDVPINHAALVKDFFLARASIEGKLNKRLSWQIGTAYRSILNERGFATPQIFELHGGLKFGF